MYAVQSFLLYVIFWPQLSLSTEKNVDQLDRQNKDINIVLLSLYYTVL